MLRLYFRIKAWAIIIKQSHIVQMEVSESIIVDNNWWVIAILAPVKAILYPPFQANNAKLM